MNQPRMNPLLFVGLVGLLTIGSSFGVQLHRAFRADRDIWWTPRKMALSVEETQDRLKMYVGGKSLEAHLSDGTLFAVDSNGQRYCVAPRDIAIRTNNWPRVQASILASALVTSFAFGIVVAVLIVGLVQVCGKRRAARERSGSAEEG